MIITINTTFKIEIETPEYLQEFENELRGIDGVNVISWQHVANTDKLYTTDKNFKRLVKAKKDASNRVLEYINKHN